MVQLSNKLTHDFENSLHQFKNLKTANDVAMFLEIPLGQLLFIAYEQTTHKKYNTFQLPKKSGGTREINSPVGGLKIILEKLKPFLEIAYTPKTCAHGFIKQKSILTNAHQHKKKKRILNADIHDFFGSINFGRVRGLFSSYPFNMGSKAATILAQLCTYKNSLPQGACTSPIIANLIAQNLDSKLIRLAKKSSMTYSRYADDLTFSTNHKNFPMEIVKSESPLELGSTLVAEINNAGFSINNNKSRLLSKNDRQEVTGLTINEFPNVSRTFIRNLRAMLYAWGKFGLLNAANRHIELIGKKHLITTDIGKENYYKQVIYGKIAFLFMVRGKDILYINTCKKLEHLDTTPPKNIKELIEMEKEFDVFISHASEDKENIARPIYEACAKLNIRAFLDEVELKWGDSLTDKINHALARSTYVLAIFSENSKNKKWPKKEFNTALNREIEGKQVLLPLVIGNSTVLDDWPLVKEKLFKEWNGDADTVAQALSKIL